MVSDRPGRKVATPRLCGLHKGALSFLFYFFYGAEALGSLVRVAVPTYGMSPWRGPSFLSPARGRGRCATSSSPWPTPISPALGPCLPSGSSRAPSSPFPGEKMVCGKCNPSSREQTVLLEADKDLQVIKSSVSPHSAHGETEALRGDGGC